MSADSHVPVSDHTPAGGPWHFVYDPARDPWVAGYRVGFWRGYTVGAAVALVAQLVARLVVRAVRARVR